MEEEDYDFNISYDQGDEKMTQKEACIALTNFFNTKFEYLPPELDQLLSFDEDIFQFANLMLNLLRTGKTSPLTQVSIDKIQLSIRALLQFISGHYEKENENKTEEIQQIKTDLLEIKTKYSKTQDDLKTAQNTILTLKSELEDAINDRNRLTKLNVQQKQDHNTEMQKYKVSYHEISDKYDDAVARIKLMNVVEDRLKNQLQLAQAEADGYAKQSEKLSNSLTEKKDKIYKLKVELKKASIEISDLQSQLASQQQQATINQTPTITQDDMTKTTLQEQKYQQQNYEYKSKIESQALEIKTLKEKISDLSEKLDKSIDQNADKDSQLKKMENQIEKLNNSLEQSQQQNDKTNDRLLKSEDQLRSKTLEHNQYQNIINRVTELLSETYNCDSPDTLPAIIEDLLEEHAANDVSPRLLSTIDALTRFILRYLLRDKVDDNILIAPLNQLLGEETDELAELPQPIQKDRKLLNEVTKMITQIRDKINEDYGKQFDQYRMFDSLLSAREMFLEDKENCEFAALCVLCAANDKLRRECIDQKKKIDTFNKVFPIASLQDTRKLFNQIAKVSQQYYKQNFDDNMQLLNYFVDNTVDLLSRLRNDVIPQLDKNCEILELPDIIIDSMHEISESIVKEANENSQILSQAQLSLRNDMLKQQTILDTTREEKRFAEKQNRKLTAKVTELVQTNNELKRKLDETILSQVDLETTFTTVKEANDGHEETIRALKQERDILQEALNRRIESAQIRCDAIIAAEREAHLQEIQRTEKLHLEDKKNILDEMQKREARFKALRSKDKELIEYLENQIKRLHKGENVSVTSSQSVQNDTLYKSIVQEISRCVQTGGQWNQQKVINAVRKIVDKVLISSTDEQWRLWGIGLLGNLDKNAKSSAIRKNIEQMVSSMKNADQNNQTLLAEKKILVKFGNEQLNKSSSLSMKGLTEAILFSVVTKKIIASKLKPRKSFV